jgi:threonine/homoserine/homoserine lactone efflux protein
MATMSALWEGMLAGYGIAIPIGAIAVLLLETSVRRGFVSGLVAGVGVAIADTIYALIASLAGIVVASALSPYASALKITSAIVLLAIGLYGLRQAIKSQRSETLGPANGASRGKIRIFWQFLGLTLLNP